MLTRAAAVVVTMVVLAEGGLQERPNKPLPVGSVTPQGWLLRQLILQAEGLSGHLSMFWPDIKDSVWIGGTHDAHLHERTPYWLNGVVPLSFLLKNAGIHSLPGVKGIYKSADAPPLNITAQVETYIQYILSHQNQETGWLGPDDNSSNPDQYWGAMNVLQSLYQYAEGMDDGSHNTPAWKNATKAIALHLLQVQKRLPKTGMVSWSQQRWMHMGLTCQWMLDNAPQGLEQNFTDLIELLHSVGSHWEQWFESFTGNAGAHNVNNAMGLKSAAVIYRSNPTATYNNYTMPQLSKRRMQHMDERYGLPTGMFNGDESLPNPPTRSPSRGIELCGVVESMFSYTVMYSVHDDLSFADRVELIAYNALPATWASPTGGDMWAHQYLQAVNEINAIKANPHFWGTDGPMAETYGLAPNYGCCTANFNQGWPKFTSNLFFTTPKGELVVGLWAPAVGKFPGGHVINVTTEYPFDSTASVEVVPQSPVTVKFRIPKWAVAATVNGEKVQNGTYSVHQVSQRTTFQLNFNAAVRVQEWDDGTHAVLHGTLLYSLPISANYTVYGHHYGTDTQSNDYYLEPTSEWRYALDLNTTNPQQSLRYHRVSGSSKAPFNHTNWPSNIEATLRQFDWDIVKNSANTPRPSPVCTGPKSTNCSQPVTVHLVPHGGTELRIGLFPLSGY